MTKTIEQIYQEFKAAFPAEAYSSDTSRGFELTSIKAQYISERLNDVMTPFGWEIEGAWEEDGKGVLFKGYLYLDYSAVGIDRKQKIQTVGYSDSKKNRGDGLKGAKTDALSKAASQLGIGNDVFKGKVKSIGGKFLPPATAENYRENYAETPVVAPKATAMLQAFRSIGVDEDDICNKMKSSVSDLSAEQFKELQHMYGDIKKGTINAESLFPHRINKK